jgi:hypothetical protein
MGKYIGYILLILAVLFALEWFEIFDVPFLEIPDFTSSKKDMIDSTKDVVEKMK